MNGNILSQRLNYFAIKAFKDYSIIPDANDSSFTQKDDNNYRMEYHVNIHPKIEGKRNGKVIYCEEPGFGFFVKLEPLLKNEFWYTLSEKQLKRHYMRLFSDVRTHVTERTITLNEEFLTFRLNRWTKERDVNCKYFKKYSKTLGVKINLKTGNILIYYRQTKKHKRKQLGDTFRQNNFGFLYKILREIIQDTSPALNTRINTEYLMEINPNEFINKLFETLSNLNNSDYSINKDYTIDDVFSIIIKQFVKLKKIKTPDNYENYLINWYPTQKYLKKNDNKLIVAILDKLNLKTKSFIKLFHENPHVNINNLIILSQMFGYETINKYLPNLNEKFYLIKSTELAIGDYTPNDEKHDFLLNSNEKNRLLKLLNSYTDIDEIRLKNIFHELNDHFMMIKRIREILPETELRAQNHIDFKSEHIELSKIENLIKKGYSIQHTFETTLIKCIEKEITCLSNNYETELFYPVILKTDEEYSEEGKHMHHCVSSYVDRKKSIIISLRKGGIMGNERVTCEFNIENKQIIQAKYFCNDAPPEEFKLSLKTLISRVKTYKGMIGPIGTEKVPLVINGVKLEIKPTPKTWFEALFAGIELENQPFF
jgi:hypothetical protein